MTTAISEPVSGARPGLGAAPAPPAPQRLPLPLPLPLPLLSVRLPRVRLLHRRRVTDLISKALADRVTVVRGPAGCGKTVACAMWAASTPDCENIAWVDLDPGDRQEGRLWGKVRAALAATGVVPGVNGLPEAADGAFPLRLAELSHVLDQPATLVVDNVQELSGSPAAAGLDLLVRHGAPGLKLLLAGRHLAGLGIARLQVGGELAEIGPADLACTPEEASDYFAHLGVDLPAGQLDDLMIRTEGWITGLRLAAMRAPAGHRITGEDPLVADYLHDEVLDQMPPDEREFLLTTSVADVICDDLAGTLTGRPDAAAVLDRLGRGNAIVAAAGQGTYRYHPLLLDLLRADLRKERPAEIPKLAVLAASWQAAHGQHGAALRNAARAGDWDLGSAVLAQAGPQLLLPEPAAVLEPALATFPASRYCGDAAVAGALAAAGLRTGDSCAAQLHLDNATAALPNCPAEQRRLVSTWLEALRLLHAAERGEANPAMIKRAADLAAQAGPESRRECEHEAAGLLWTSVTIAALASSLVAEGRDASEQACRQFSAGSRPEFRAQAAGWRAVAEAMYGDLLAASELLADPMTDRQLGHLADAYLHLAKDEVAAARRLLESAQHGTGAGCGSKVARSLASIASARLALCEGDQAAARRLLTRLRYQSAQPANGQPASTQLDAGLAVLDADVAVSEGNATGARLALARAGEQAPRRAEVLAGSARALLAEGDAVTALATAESCLAGTGGPITLRDQVSVLVTAAVAQRRLGQADQAADQLGYALALAEPHGMYRPFLDGGAPVRSALTVLIRPANQGAATAAKILQRFDTRSARSGTQPAVVPLTSSELAVLRFLPSHMTNQEIAEALFLSINTVKTHLRSVYRKLGVTTRRQAIYTAGRLGLL
jgi:LuxR family maltose regulon positive regulatory protein